MSKGTIAPKSPFEPLIPSQALTLHPGVQSHGGGAVPEPDFLNTKGWLRMVGDGEVSSFENTSLDVLF